MDCQVDAAPRSDLKEQVVRMGSKKIKYMISTIPSASATASAPIATLLCFHGSGDTLTSWNSFRDLFLSSPICGYSKLLLYKRLSCEDIETSIASLCYLLNTLDLSPPFILIAHSYGGRVARDFLQQHCSDVGGLILVETGQETPSKYEKEQYQRQILGTRPLVVIRGNSLIAKQGKSADMETNALLESESRKLLEQWDKTDQMLKREQLRLSSNTKWIEARDCGHHVIRDRPDVVVEGLQWVLDQLRLENGDGQGFLRTPKKVLGLTCYRLSCKRL